MFKGTPIKLKPGMNVNLKIADPADLEKNQSRLNSVEVWYQEYLMGHIAIEHTKRIVRWLKSPASISVIIPEGANRTNRNNLKGKVISCLVWHKQNISGSY